MGMNKAIVKYDGNIFMRFFGKIRGMFIKKEEVKNTGKAVNTILANKFEKSISDKKEYNIEELINKYEISKSGKEKLNPDEEKAILNYYKKKNEELDREIQYCRVELKKINSKITSYYKKAIEIKEASV